MMNILKDFWPVPLVLVLCGLLAWVAHSSGYAQAEAEGLSALNALKVEHSEKQRLAAEAYGKALADTLTKYQDEVKRAEKVAKDLRTKLAAHERENENLRRRIKNATARSTHTFSPDFIVVCNEAFGADIPTNALPAAGGAGGTDGSAGGSAGAVDAGLFSGVSEADLLAWLVQRGQVYRDMKSRLQSWQELARGWEGHGDGRK